MSTSLKDTFNDIAPVKAFAARLDEVLAALPATLAAMKPEDNKSIVHFLVPVDLGVFSDQAFGDRALTDIGAPRVSARDVLIGEMMFAFAQKIAALGDMECFFSDKSSMWGDYMGVSIVTDRPNLLTIAARGGKPYTDAKSYFMAEGIEELIGEKGTQDYFQLLNALNHQTTVCLFARAKDVDPNTLPNSSRDMLRLQEKTLFCNLWPQHAMTPQKPLGANIVPKP